MEYRQLGHTEIKISALGLGTMTWGMQNNKDEAFQQMDYAIAQGINFFDTAELYPIPPQPQTYTQTETIIGQWLKQTGNRNKVILASKIAGPGLSHIRNGSGYTKKHLLEALNGSLKRLNTDVIDIYQLHWPERQTNFFGKLIYQPPEQDDFTPFEDILEVLQQCIEAGKIRTIGVSNETPWGVMKYLNLAVLKDLPRIVSIQNPYNLLNRTFEVGLAEVAHRESVGLLAYSPLGFGTLTGKYLNKPPSNGRLTLFPHYTRYSNPFAVKAIENYVHLANQIGCQASQLALSFVTQQHFTTSTLLGATTLDQLKENLDSIHVKLTDETLAAIDEIHRQHPFPCP